MNRPFWAGKRVFVTGHSGFMGGWLSLVLREAGADVTGFALTPPSEPNFFTLTRLASGMCSIMGDIRDAAAIERAVVEARPEVLFHLAAQPLVRASYADPAGTYTTNVVGTVHVFEAARKAGVRTIVNVTSDKCYENREWPWGYRESDAMGGYDPYSSSKGCAEIVTAAYRRSFFAQSGAGVASVRAGNVIGGGDWASDRIVPDFIRAVSAGKPLRVRNPNAVRPWQHVLEPVFAYLLLAEHLASDPVRFAEGWNIGPQEGDAQTVGAVVERLTRLWGAGAAWETDRGPHPHEANYLKLDCSKARQELGWAPRWSLDDTLERLVEWYRAWHGGADMRATSLAQIAAFTSAGAAAAVSKG